MEQRIPLAGIGRRRSTRVRAPTISTKFAKETNKSFRLGRDLRLLHDLTPPIHNANARELQRDVDSDIVFHGCPPSQMPGADSTSCPRFIIYRGTATFTARSVQGPLRHLANF